MAECGIELLAQEKERQHSHTQAAAKKGRGALLGQGLARIMRDHARLVTPPATACNSGCNRTWSRL